MNYGNDEKSIYILKTIVQTHLQSDAGERLPEPDMQAALEAGFGEFYSRVVSEGDLARAALDVLSQDPVFAEPIRVMASQVARPVGRQRYLEPSTIALATASLLVLQTRVKFKLDHNGKWSVEIEKKSSGDATVKLLAQRLLSFLHR